MNKGFTSIEQSRHLLELGLDPETADMVYPAWTLSDTPTEDIVNIRRHDYENDNDVPCWSLAALLDLMPQTNKFHTRLLLEFNRVIFEPCDDEIIVNESTFHYSDGTNLLDAVVDMVIWLLENGYIEKK